jgi:thiol-disulfide isomerase/thioredoxin
MKYLGLTLFCLIYVNAESQNVYSHFASGGLSADSFWAKMPKTQYDKDILEIYNSLSHKLYRTQEEVKEFDSVRIKMMIAEEYGRRALRNWGLTFWMRYPHDKRRFDWLLRTVNDPPTYFTNVEEGMTEWAHETYGAPFDEKAEREWKAKYSRFRKEFMNSDQISVAKKEKLIQYELTGEPFQYFWVDNRRRRAWDYAKWEKKVVIFARWWYSNVYDKDPDRYSRGGIDMAQEWFVDEIVTNQRQLGFTSVDVEHILRLFKRSGVTRLQENAQQKLSLMKLSAKPFTFSGISTDGDTIDVKRLRGKVVLVDFWNTGCVGCIQMMPFVDSIYKKYRTDGFEVISLCCPLPGDTASDRGLAIKIHERAGAGLPLVYLSRQQFAKLYGEFGFVGAPQLLLLDQKGDLVMYNDALLIHGGLESLVKKLLSAPGQGKNSIKLSKEAGYIIEGTMEGAGDSTVVYLVDNMKIDTVEKTTIKRGKFSFKGQLSAEPAWYSVRLKGQRTWPTFLLENSRIVIRGNVEDFERAKVNGSKTNQEYEEFKNTDNEFIKGRDSLVKEILAAKKLKDKENASNLQLERDSGAIRRAAFWAAFIQSHPDSKYTPYLILSDVRFEYSRKQAEYDNLTPEVKKSNFGLLLNEEIVRERLRSTIKIGNIAPDFSSITPNGDSLSLSQVIKNSKLTLIDFWASWCGPCRAETPNLREVYRDFHNKGFNILSVSFDGEEKSWKDAIAKDSMNWNQVSELKFRDESAGLLYGVDGIPASVLVDSVGRILAIDAPGAKIPSGGGSLRGKELYQKVHDLLGE